MSDFTPRPRRRQSGLPKYGDPDFPLRVHKGTGYFCRKVRGWVYYFGKLADDPKGEAALNQWLAEKDDLLAGREPRDKSRADELVVGELCNRFLAQKESLRDNGELSPRTFATYYSTCEELVKVFGRNRTVSDLTADDFRKLRVKLAKGRKLVALRNSMVRVLSVFKFAFDEGLIPTVPRYGQGFKLPKAEKIDAEREAQRAQNGPVMFEADEIRLMLDALAGKEVTLKTIDEETGQPAKVTLKANPGLRAMIMLAANCGFGQSDLANLTTRAVNLETGWVNFGRGKTGVARKIPLWAETISAIRDWLPHRPKAREKADEQLLFLTVRGARFVRVNPRSGHHSDGVGQEFQKLIAKLGLKRPRLGVYSLRHSFETIAGETGDQVAVDAVMGHKDRTMAAHYRERIGDERLRRVVEHVRAWVFAAADSTPDGPQDSTPPEICVRSARCVRDDDEGQTEERTQSPQRTQKSATVLKSDTRPVFRVVG